jgi:alkylhydroperoxidase family enzyme
VRAARCGTGEAFRDPGELALLDWVDAVALGPGPVPTAAREALRSRVGDPAPALVELTLLVGATVMLNRFCTGLDLPTPPGVVARLAAEGLA